MARARVLLPFTPSKFLIFLILSTLVIIRVHGDIDQDFVRTLDSKKEKLSHFQFYWHDIVSGKNQTSVEAVKPISNTSATFFGKISVIDDTLTVGPQLSSKLIGRAQGFYAYSSQEEIRLLMAMNLVIVEGKYSGSTLTVLGRNAVFSKFREMPVIGGSGLFRFARGYVKASTYKLDATTAVVKYDGHVLHY